MNDIRLPDTAIEREDEGLLDDRYHIGRIDGEDRFCEIVLRQFCSDVDETPSDCNTILIAVTGCARLNADDSGATD